MVANKRNIATEAVAFMFLFVRDDIDQPRLTTTEPCEHTFGQWRVSRCEATVLECIHLEDKRDRKTRALFASNLPSSRDPKNGYQATFDDFIDSNKTEFVNPQIYSERAHVDFDDDSVVDTLWPHVKPIINECTMRMEAMLNRLGVDDSEKSPFLRQFETAEELAKVYEDYTKLSETIEDGEEDEAVGDDGSVEDDVCKEGSEIEGVSVGEERRIRDFINAALEKDDNNNGDDPDDTQNPAAVLPEVESECAGSSDVLSGWSAIVDGAIDNLALLCRSGLGFLDGSKVKGSISSDTKRKSLQGRWFTPKKKMDDCNAKADGKFIERNVWVKLQMKEMMGSSIAVEDLVNYRVLGVFTKSYNKWMLCDIGRQAWNEGMNKGKYRVLLRMIRFDHIRGAWEDNDPSLRIKWKQMRSYFVLADASDISDVVEKLGVH
jgi:hypothetical protein